MEQRKVALITGITGQDCSYLSRLLLDKGYKVSGIIRKSSTFNTERIDDVFDRLDLHYGDVLDPGRLTSIIASVKPTEIYNLAAQSHVRVSFDLPHYTCSVDALGPLNVLEAVRSLGMEKDVKIYQASSSEMFGDAAPPQNENTPFSPRSPYGAAKAFAFDICKNYRDAYGMHVSNGILFNHESPVRSKTFVTRKVTSYVAEFSKKMTEGGPGISPLHIGNIYARRDWGHAKDYVEAMWLMLQQDKPDDYVIATHISYSIKQLIDFAFSNIGISINWAEWDEDGIAYEGISGAPIIVSDKRYYRPTEVDFLMGDYNKAKEKLGWEPKTSFQELIKEMVVSDRKKL